MSPEPSRLMALALALAIGVPGHAASQATVSGLVRNGGSAIGEAAVYMTPLDTEAASDPRALTTIDQIHLKFVPRVAIVTPGTEIAFLNSDDVLHNVFGPGLGGTDQFDLGTYPRGDARSWVFREHGLHVVLCHIHPEMAAYVIVAPTPFTALSEPDGSFRIDGVPPGRYDLRTWHVRHWRSEQTIEVTVGENDLTDVVITLGGR